MLELFELIDIEELFESLLERYQEGLEEKMKGSEFVYDSTDLLHYKLHKISLNRGGHKQILLNCCKLRKHQ